MTEYANARDELNKRLPPGAGFAFKPAKHVLTGSQLEWQVALVGRWGETWACDTYVGTGARKVDAKEEAARKCLDYGVKRGVIEDGPRPRSAVPEKVPSDLPYGWELLCENDDKVRRAAEALVVAIDPRARVVWGE